MSGEHKPTLQQIAADRDWWSVDARTHYRELAHRLRGIAAKCRLPNTQKELLDLARRYDTRADRLVADLLTLAGRRGVPAGGLLGMVRLSDLGISRRY